MSCHCEKVANLKIRYHREKFPNLKDVEQHGNFIDLHTAEDVDLKAGDFKLINMGISMKVEKGYWIQLVPRSSTFKNYGIIQTNSFGVIDTDYCGDDDYIMMPIYATKDITIPANTRICQFRLVKDIPTEIEVVEKLDDKNRGGFGSSGK